MKRYFYKLVIEYDGTDFCGWQVQPNKRTVQGEIEKAISAITRTPVRIFGAGRTDSGVHARMQIASFYLDKLIDHREVETRLNRMLPKDIAIKKLVRAAVGFNPRRQATLRTYRYFIAEDRNPFLRRFSYHIGRKLNIDKLNDGAALFEGEHDFGSLCKQSSRKQNNYCVVHKSRWFRRGRLVCYEISADRFLHNMVRRIVGVMLAYEQTKLSLTQIKAILNNNFDEQVKFNAPPCGLILHEIKFGKVKK